MSMDGIRVNHGGLEQAINALLNGVKEINDRMDLLENELAPLRSDWTGNAQVSYAQAKAKWDNAINDMKLLLQDTATAVDESGAAYKDADKRGAAAFEM